MPAPQARAAATARLSLTLRLVNELNLPEAAERIYQDDGQIVDVYQSPQTGSFILHFLQGAVIRLQPDTSAGVQGQITEPIFHHGQLEDVTLTALAPLLRRHGCYLVHAAAVSSGSGALLLVGPSHSGKTTSGLRLVLAGHKHLASDVVLLSQVGNQIYAFPTPGTATIRARTLQLLPQLEALIEDDDSALAVQDGLRVRIAPEQWGAPAPVVAIFFPTIGGTTQSTVRPLEQGVALAKLMEESIDRWDSAVLLNHMAFLTALSQQARCLRLALGADVDSLPSLLESAL